MRHVLGTEEREREREGGRGREGGRERKREREREGGGKEHCHTQQLQQTTPDMDINVYTQPGHNSSANVYYTVTHDYITDFESNYTAE